METADRDRVPRLLSALAGLHLGVLAALAAVPWFAFHALLHGQRWLATLNLLGSTVYGDRAFRGLAGMATLAGLAIHVVSFGLAGMLFGLLVPAGLKSLRAALLALAASIAWYFLVYGVVWKRINPLVPLYASDTAIFVSHLLLGAFLARWRSTAVSLSRSAGAPPVALSDEVLDHGLPQ